MTTRRKIYVLVCGVIVTVFVLTAYLVLPGVLFERAVWKSMGEQQLLFEGATPLFDKVIAQRLAVGDTLEHAKKVLTDAGQEFTIDSDYPTGRKLQCFCAIGRGAGFSIELHLDNNDRIGKIDINKAFEGP